MDCLEARIQGRTEALDFIDNLGVEWIELVKQYEKLGRSKEADIFETCVQMLDDKMEEFAET